MESIKIENMLTLEETIAKNLFEGVVYPWEVLPKIKDFIIELGKTRDDIIVMDADLAAAT